MFNKTYNYKKIIITNAEIFLFENYYFKNFLLIKIIIHIMLFFKNKIKKSIQFSMPGFSIFSTNIPVQKIILIVQREYGEILFNHQTTDFQLENIEETMNFLQHQESFECQEEGAEKLFNVSFIAKKTRIVMQSFPRFKDFICIGNSIDLVFKQNNEDITRYSAMIYPYSILNTTNPDGKYIKLYKMRGLDVDHSSLEDDILFWFNTNKMIISINSPAPSTISANTATSGEDIL